MLNLDTNTNKAMITMKPAGGLKTDDVDVNGFYSSHGGAPCATEEECSLGGVCTGSRCSCDVWFTGSNCSLLNLQPAKVS